MLAVLSSANRTAMLTALAALVGALTPTVVDGTTPSVPQILLAVGGALTAYVGSYQAIGLTAKLTIGAVVAALTTTASGLVDGLSVTAIVLTAIGVVLGELLAGSAAPSTAGSVARDRLDLAA